MNEFFNFLFDTLTLESLVRDKWEKIYDLNFIYATVIGSLEKNIILFKGILTQLS